MASIANCPTYSGRGVTWSDFIESTARFFIFHIIIIIDLRIQYNSLSYIMAYMGDIDYSVQSQYN